MNAIQPLELLATQGEHHGQAKMNFLFLGKDNGRVAQLITMIGRADIVLEHTETPEAAFFDIIRGAVTALILDCTDPEIDPMDVIGNLDSIDQEFEILLIVDPAKADQLPKTLMRSCYGILLPTIQSAANRLVIRQLTEKLTLKDSIEKLRNTSIIDGLTQLHNHAFFQQHLTREIELAREDETPITLVMLDIDHFKHYNDTNGHPAGDDVLRSIARLMEASVRQFDFTARYGGEEFVIVFPNVHLKTALSVTERFRQKVETTGFEFGHLQPLGFVSASFGVAMLDHKGIKTKQELIQAADQALYKAKKNKRNEIWYNHDNTFSQFKPSLLA